MMQAIILAAGYATRLKDRAQGRAKALMPIGEKPIINFILDDMARIEGLTHVHVVSNHVYINQFEECRGMSRARGVKFTPKFFILALLVAYVFVTAAVVRDGSTLSQQSATIAELEQQKEQMKLQNERLKSEAEFSRTTEFIERQARARGMIKPDETRYVLSTGGDYAQGGN